MRVIECIRKEKNMNIIIKLVIVAVLFVVNFLVSSHLDKVAEKKAEKNEKMLKIMKNVFNVQAIVYLIVGTIPMLFLFGGLETWFQFCEGSIKVDFVTAFLFLTLSVACSYMKQGVEYMLGTGEKKVFGLKIVGQGEV